MSELALKVKNYWESFYARMNSDFPYMIEIFSRNPSGYDLAEGSHLTPIHFADEISSLSAILLDDEYYNFMLAGKKIIEGVSIIDEHHLIPLKAALPRLICPVFRGAAALEGIIDHRPSMDILSPHVSWKMASALCCTY